MATKAQILAGVPGAKAYKSISEAMTDVRATLEKQHYDTHQKLKKRAASGNRRKGP